MYQIKMYTYISTTNIIYKKVSKDETESQPLMCEIKLDLLERDKIAV